MKEKKLCIFCQDPIWKGNKYHRNYWGLYCEAHKKGETYCFNCGRTLKKPTVWVDEDKRCYCCQRCIDIVTCRYTKR